MEIEVDGDGEFLAAAREDDALVAQLLIRLSRSTTYVPWHQLPESKPPTEDAPAPPLPPPTWGGRRTRSGALVAAEGAKTEEEAAGGTSPATPLSWSGASGTSGSGSDDGWSAPPQKPKRRREVHERGELGQPPRAESTDGAEVCRGAGEQIGAPAAKGTTTELSREGGPAPNWAKAGSSDEGGEPHGDSVVGATPAVDYPAAGSGSSKAAAVAAAATATTLLGSTRSIAHAEPLRSRLTAEGGNSVVFGRQGKKKTILELRAMKDTLLREQEQLQKELGKQREMYGALMEENMALKKLESTLPSLMVSKPYVALACGEAKLEQPDHMQSASEWQAPNGVGTAYVVNDVENPEQPQCTRSSPSTPARRCLFDLNCLPDGDL